MKFKGFDIDLKNLDYPVTVCAHADCKRFVAVGNTEVTNTVYDVTCHKHCTLKGLPTETVNEPRLATCTAFEFDTDTAKSKFFCRKVTEFPGFVDCGDAEEGHANWECDLEALLSTLTPKKR